MDNANQTTVEILSEVEAFTSAFDSVFETASDIMSMLYHIDRELDETKLTWSHVADLNRIAEVLKQTAAEITPHIDAIPTRY